MYYQQTCMIKSLIRIKREVHAQKIVVFALFALCTKALHYRFRLKVNGEKLFVSC